MAAVRPVVFPTYVGVILRERYGSEKALGIPHIRGGDPDPNVFNEEVPLYSPHTWG